MRRIERALELDPDYAIAWVMLGWIYQYYSDVAAGVSDARERETALVSMLNCAQKAIEVDPGCADAYSLMAMYHREMHEFNEAIECAEKSIMLAPNNAENLAVAAGTMTKSGKPERGLELIKRAMRVCPLYRPGFLRALGAAYRLTDRLEEAVLVFRESLKRESSYLAPHVNLTSILGELGRIEEATEAAREIFRLKPDFSIKAYVEGLSYRNPQDSKRIEEGLRKAGLPDS